MDYDEEENIYESQKSNSSYETIEDNLDNGEIDNENHYINISSPHGVVSGNNGEGLLRQEDIINNNTM